MRVRPIKQTASSRPHNRTVVSKIICQRNLAARQSVLSSMTAEQHNSTKAYSTGSQQHSLPWSRFGQAEMGVRQTKRASLQENPANGNLTRHDSAVACCTALAACSSTIPPSTSMKQGLLHEVEHISLVACTSCKPSIGLEAL